jgi:PmbA protein
MPLRKVTLKKGAGSKQKKAAPEDSPYSDPARVVSLALKAGADEAQVEVKEGVVTQVRFAGNEVTVSNSRAGRSASLFLNFGKRLVSADVDDLASIPAVIEELVALAKATQPNQEYVGLAKVKAKYRKSTPAADLKSAADKLVGIAGKAIDAALAAGASRSAGTVQLDLGKAHLATSQGVDATAAAGTIDLSMRAFCDELATGHAVSVATSLSELDPSGAGKRAGALASRCRKLPRRDMDPGKHDVVFDRLAYADFVSFAGNSTSAFDVDAGFSPFKDKLGSKVAAGSFNLEDDGTRDDGLGSSPFDDEGVPTGRTELIKDGVLTHLLHNTTTATRHKTQTTGNAGLISPDPWNLVVETGKGDHESLWSEMGRGLFVTNVWYTRFADYVAGDFSTIPRDAILVIEGGEPVAATQGLRVTDNLLGILARSEVLGGDVQQIRWWEVRTPTFTPSALVRQVNITKSTK